ncbi:Nucleolar protein 9 [Apophysomyces sp. BC1034]|nr:Nucleolar protein 9 [Apophysomyces sp. BC1015]KAG0170216.1 Nucleolar protein 9 [Apophysomyces sp. BC1021]KAG0184626.1 Nucleolar protein 9 [Apophysomyces sp. BC1034]
MPREERKPRANKKRGKKQKSTEKNAAQGVEIFPPTADQSNFDSVPENRQEVDEQHFHAGHYGEVDEQMLGYFKNVENSLDDPQFESAEDQRLFVGNVYTEVEGNELRLSTNYSCSLILEKLLKVSDPFQLRVFMDKLSGRSVELFAHRFASHVCQTLLTLAADVVEQEVINGTTSKPSGEDSEEVGQLLSMEEFVLGMCEDIIPVVGGLISQQFASHVIRVLLFVLAGKRVDETGDVKGRLRSKKSAKYKTENNDNLTKSSGRASRTRRVPASFKAMFRKLTTELAINSSETEVRALSVHRVANPVLQLLLEMQENDEEGQNAKKVLIDRILWGIVTDMESATENKDRDSWFETLIRDQVGSHLLEVIMKEAPTSVYNKIYTTYLRKKLEKFSLHPIGNFVIQNLLTSAKTADQFQLMVKELSGSFEKLMKNGKYGVIRSLVDSSARLGTGEQEVIQALTGALHISEAYADRKEFVNCVMRMWNLEDWNNASEEEKRDTRNFHLQGSLILQSMVKMAPEHNAIVTNRAYESILISETVNEKMKKRILKNLQNTYPALAKDKFGSHIVERCWAVADIEMKEKIATELLKRERDLSEHYIGKCILWTCRIEQFKRHYDDWVQREKGSERKRELFQDILDEKDVKTSKKKRKA